MSAVIHPFPYGEPEPPKVEPDIVAELERLLELAKNGDVDGIAVALIMPNGSTQTSFVLNGNHHKLTLAVDILHHRLVRNLIDEQGYQP
jgi:hypothetical protein